MIILLVDLFGPKAHHRIRLLLDTGAAGTLVRSEILAAIGSPPETDAIIAGVGGLATANTHSIDKLVLGKFDIPVTSVIGRDLPPHLPIDGLLGLDVLRYFRMDLDLSQNSLVLTPSRVEAPE